MNFNRSLSARIKRRNNQGFKGLGNHTYGRVECGNYLDYRKSNKYQGVINKMRKMGKFGIKHPGSKPLKTLKIYC